MGDFTLVYWFCFLFPFGLIFGALVGFMGIPTLASLEKFAWLDRYNNKKVKLIITLMLGLLFVLVFYNVSVMRMVNNSKNYWSNTTMFDYPRMPLSYPYHMVEFGNEGEGVLAQWETGDQPVEGVLRFAQEDVWVAGEAAAGANPDGEQWFIFNCDTGEVTWYADQEAFTAAAGDLGFEADFELTPVEAMIQNYWAEHPDN